MRSSHAPYSDEYELDEIPVDKQAILRRSSLVSPVTGPNTQHIRAGRPDQRFTLGRGNQRATLTSRLSMEINTSSLQQTAYDKSSPTVPSSPSETSTGQHSQSSIIGPGHNDPYSTVGSPLDSDSSSLSSTIKSRRRSAILGGDADLARRASAILGPFSISNDPKHRDVELEERRSRPIGIIEDSSDLLPASEQSTPKGRSDQPHPTPSRPRIRRASLSSPGGFPWSKTSLSRPEPRQRRLSGVVDEDRRSDGSQSQGSSPGVHPASNVILRRPSHRHFHSMSGYATARMTSSTDDSPSPGPVSPIFPSESISPTQSMSPQRSRLGLRRWLSRSTKSVDIPLQDSPASASGLLESPSTGTLKPYEISSDFFQTPLAESGRSSQSEMFLSTDSYDHRPPSSNDPSPRSPYTKRTEESALLARRRMAGGDIFDRAFKLHNEGTTSPLSSTQMDSYMLSNRTKDRKPTGFLEYRGFSNDESIRSWYGEEKEFPLETPDTEAPPIGSIGPWKKGPSTPGEDDYFRIRVDVNPVPNDAPLTPPDLPEHLPSSPLCPLHPKYKGRKPGYCTYHSRGRTKLTGMGYFR